MEEDDGFDFVFDFGFVIFDEEDRRIFFGVMRGKLLCEENVWNSIRQCEPLFGFNQGFIQGKMNADVAAVIMI